ncbi:MAG: acetyl-CoA carboxylase biotin carboxyl carrier protein subunit [Bacteroidetes bacterium 4572_112]|nr:MAG: acetyl-CoA carboxylase biotin carboxyl carrier protein subunit [Bacteroidetes bacterium 4572_112]
MANKKKTPTEKVDSEFQDFRVGDTIYRTKLTKAYLERKPYTIPNKKSSLAFIPGTIAEIFVKKGDKVKEGEIMMLLEAMKMKNRVIAPFDGVVKDVYVEVGQVVAKNFVMVELV